MKAIFGQQTTKVKQLADLLSQEIAMDAYKADNALPSINQLSLSYKVSRDTVFKAFVDLKERGIIDSTPGKGYYVVNKQQDVLLLLDEYSPFKDTLYNGFIKRLSTRYKVDLWFHQYNEQLFNTILRQSFGRYSKYVVMNFDNENLSPLLSKIDAAKLLLLDFGNFDKKDYSYICQDFGEFFYQALLQLAGHMQRFRKVVLLFAQGTKHPQSTCHSFCKFCADQHLVSEVLDTIDAIEVHKGEVYVAIRQVDVVNIIKKSRAEGLKCGVDFGLIAYNETPAYAVIDEGITALSVNWEAMGNRAAEFVLTGKPIQVYLPTEIHLRKSI